MMLFDIAHKATQIQNFLCKKQPEYSVFVDLGLVFFGKCLIFYFISVKPLTFCEKCCIFNITNFVFVLKSFVFDDYDNFQELN